MVLILREESMEGRMKRLVICSRNFFETIVGNSLDRLMLMMKMHVQDGEERKWIALNAICLDGCAYGWLAEY